MADRALIDIIHDDDIEVYAVTDPMGIEVGILELDFRSLPDCELSFFALIPELAGKGHGRWLMAHAQMLAWRVGVERFWVHTCPLDHPTALGFYRRSGFIPCMRQVEIFDDRWEEHTSELPSLMRISYAVFCLKKKNTQNNMPLKKLQK